MSELNTSIEMGKRFLAAQRDLESAKKSSTNPHFRNKYADINEVLSVAKEALHKHDLFVMQPVNKDEHGYYVETRIMAPEGLVANSAVYLSGSEGNMQQIGAAITYARRYGLVSLLALESEDDDGEVASKAPSPAKDAPSKALTKKDIHAEIGAKSAAVVARKRATIEELQHHLTKTYKVIKKDQLEEMDALAFLAYLNGLLK